MQLETSSANEKRIESKAGALCVEIARQETLFLLHATHRG